MLISFYTDKILHEFNKGKAYTKSWSGFHSLHHYPLHTKYFSFHKNKNLIQLTYDWFYTFHCKAPLQYILLSSMANLCCNPLWWQRNSTNNSFMCFAVKYSSVPTFTTFSSQEALPSFSLPNLFCNQSRSIATTITSKVKYQVRFLHYFLSYIVSIITVQ